MDRYLSTNDRLINLQNVSNINVLTNSYRIIFNFNYGIDMGKKTISDYVYWDAIDVHNFNYNLSVLNANKYFIDNYLDQINGNGYINKNEISSIKFSEKKNRVIFNLSHSITFTDFYGNDKITSEFVYVNCNNNQEFKDYSQYVKSKLTKN